MISRQFLWEMVQAIAWLFGVGLLLILFLIVPMIINQYHGPGWGFVIAFGALPLWKRFGPPSMPGMLNGIICIIGYAGIGFVLFRQALLCLLQLVACLKSILV